MRIGGGKGTTPLRLGRPSSDGKATTKEWHTAAGAFLFPLQVSRMSTSVGTGNTPCACDPYVLLASGLLHVLYFLIGL